MTRQVSLNMHERWVVVVTLIFAAVLVAGLLAPTAAADGSVPLGGGAGITVNGTPCTLATIGHDNTGELVGFTAASCGGPGSPVAIAGSERSRLVDRRGLFHGHHSAA